MRWLVTSFLVLFQLLYGLSIYASDTIYYEIWDIASLDTIGGHGVTVFGDPQVVPSDIGKAVQFDGVEDQLLVDFNPLKDATEFTVELVFNPDACYPDNTAPRFVHIQDPDDPEGKRVMMELRINENNQCYLDGYVKTDREGLTLIDEFLVHPTEKWHHAALTYKDSVLTTWFNGEKELNGILKYTSTIVNDTGKTSLGARMNKVTHYSGLMKTLKVTHACLEPEDFIFIHDQADSSGTGIPMLEKGSRWRAFPNPADQILSLDIEWIKDRRCMEVSIFDLSGKIYLRQEYLDISGGVVSIDTSSFHEGVYIIRLSSDHLTDHRKIVVMH
jgi:hypothetical protein